MHYHLLSRHRRGICIHQVVTQIRTWYFFLLVLCRPGVGCLLNFDDIFIHLQSDHRSVTHLAQELVLVFSAERSVLTS